MINSIRHTKLTVLLFLVLVLALVGKPSAAQNPDSLRLVIHSTQNDSIRIEAMLKLVNIISEAHPDSAMLITDQAEMCLPKKNPDYLNAKILTAKALIYQNIARFPEALEIFYQVKNLLADFKGPLNDTIISHFYLQTLNNIGLLFFQTRKFSEANDYFESGINYFNQHIKNQQSIENKEFLFKFNLNICGVHLQLREFKKAEVYATKAMQFVNENDFLAYGSLLNNLSIIARETGDLNKAFDLNRKALELWKENDYERGMAQAYNNLGHCYFTDNNKTKALQYYQLAYDISEKKGVKSSALIALEMISTIYAQLNRFQDAYDYHLLYKNLNDSLLNIEKIRLITQLELQEKFDKRIHENKLMQEKKESEQRTRELIYSLITVFSVMALIILVLLYNLQRSKARRHRLEAEKSNLLSKSLEMQKAGLEEDLEFKNKELATNVMYMVRKNELITNISEKLIKSRLGFKKENQAIVDEIIRDLQSTIDDDIWEEFEIRFQQVHNEFYDKLNEKIPNLTANEKKLCAFLRLNMSTKEISAITYQSINSITVARSRLRKKLELDSDESLITFLEGI